MPSYEYTLTRKRVKHVNLRVQKDGSLHLSAPFGLSRARIDDFVVDKHGWIDGARARIAAREPRVLPEAPALSPAQCEAALWPYVQDALALLGEKQPVQLTTRLCRSRFGSCNPATRRLMLNRLLVNAAPDLIEYVALHECVHLLVPNHGPAFHALMAHHMPDYRARRARLRTLL